ncbi:hypothetical protein ACQP2T_31690 [Nonomuraea sp. CA-143628]|uniref:hypothetical protein n=1 Tax=Nonomuraea sp. CA-143628 TaxID=3239997 RepID=UPI003D946D71
MFTWHDSRGFLIMHVDPPQAIARNTAYRPAMDALDLLERYADIPNTTRHYDAGENVPIQGVVPDGRPRYRPSASSVSSSHVGVVLSVVEQFELVEHWTILEDERTGSERSGSDQHPVPRMHTAAGSGLIRPKFRQCYRDPPVRGPALPISPEIGSQ